MAEDLHKTKINLSLAGVETGDGNSVVNNEGKIRQDFIITEGNLCNTFGLREEIAAQSLILSALSGQVHDEISQLVPSSSRTTPSSCPELDTPTRLTSSRPSTHGLDETVSCQDLSSENSQNYLDNGRTNLSFRVSPEVGVQLIAIQRAVDAENVNNTSESNNTTYLHGARHLSQQEDSSVVNLHVLDETIKTENEDACNTGNNSTSLEQQIVNQLQVDLEAETARHSEVEVSNFSEDENKINTQATPLSSHYIAHPGNEIELLLGNPRNSQLFVANTASESHEIIKRYAEETMSTFVSMRKMKQFGITGKCSFSSILSIKHNYIHI